MGNKADRVLYLGTADGLYLGESHGSGFRSSLLGLEKTGVMRATVVIDPEDSRRLFAGTTRAGIWRSEDGGDHWEEINRGLVYKDVWSLVRHPRTGTLIAGTSPAAVFTSADGGDHWTECEQLETLPTTKQWTGPLPPHVSRMKTLHVHVDDPRLIYGAIEEGWAVRSLDGGTSWQQLAEGFDHDGHAIAIMPENPRTIVATGGKGIYRSVDGGDSWVKCNEGFEPRRYTPAPMAMHPARPKVILTAVSATGPGGWNRPEGLGIAFVRSEDEGSSWRVLERALPADFHAVPRGLTVDPEDPDVCFAGMTDGTVWMSEDGGDTFRQILGGLPAVHSIAVGRR
jgi:photosystem II stability/assembly factor-like uncharacterized protein